MDTPLKEHEYICVASYSCEMTEDDYEKGLVSGGFYNWWSDESVEINHNRFKTINDALKAVMDANGFEYNENDFEYVGEELDEEGRFDTDILVDENNAVATEKDMEEWKNGTKKLYNCHFAVYLCVMSERMINAEDVKIFKEHSSK